MQSGVAIDGYGVSSRSTLAHCADYIRDVDEAGTVQMGPVVHRHKNVSTLTTADGIRDPRLELVGVDCLKRDLCTKRPRRFRDLALQFEVGFWDKVDPAHDMKSGPLTERRRARCLQDVHNAS